MNFPIEGGCACRYVRYRMLKTPMVVNCCHCRWCRRETGSAFAVNAVLEADQVELLSGEPQIVDTPSQSGYGQRIARCPRCLASHSYQDVILATHRGGSQ